MTTRNIKPASIFDTGAHTRTELKKIGRSLREQVPLHEHEVWEPAGNRVDPIDILQSQDAVRLQELIPVRYGRMLASPFSFFRGASAVMAGDLAGTPTTKVNVQACCDAHIDNFGIYASAERQIVFDLNDFDETLPAPPGSTTSSDSQRASHWMRGKLDTRINKLSKSSARAFRNMQAFWRTCRKSQASTFTTLVWTKVCSWQ